MKNRKLTRFEIWLQKHPTVVRTWDIVLLTLLLFTALCLARNAFEKESQREDTELKNWKVQGFDVGQHAVKTKGEVR